MNPMLCVQSHNIYPNKLIADAEAKKLAPCRKANGNNRGKSSNVRGGGTERGSGKCKRESK